MPARPDPAADDRPVVYGYIRTAHLDEAVIRQARAEIAAYCAAHGFRLATIMCDRDCPDTTTARPGFTAVLDALAIKTSHALITPSLDHLSGDRLTCSGLTKMVRRTGATVLTVADGKGGQS